MKSNILVVDDEPVARQSLSDILRLEGYIVNAVPNGQAAVEYVRTHPVELMVVDLRMPGMDGFALLRAIRAEEASIDALGFWDEQLALVGAHQAGDGAGLVLHLDALVAVLRGRQLDDHADDLHLLLARLDALDGDGVAQVAPLPQHLGDLPVAVLEVGDEVLRREHHALVGSFEREAIENGAVHANGADLQARIGTCDREEMEILVVGCRQNGSRHVAVGYRVQGVSPTAGDDVGRTPCRLETLVVVLVSADHEVYAPLFEQIRPRIAHLSPMHIFDPGNGAWSPVN